MDYTTLEAEIDHGRVTVKDPGRLPERGRGLLIVLPAVDFAGDRAAPRKRVELPLIPGDDKHVIRPTPEELDDSLWN
jgi:hypothetical protein